MRFSVIVPHYNDYVGVLRLVKSLSNSQNIEIIIVDDSSSKDVVNELQYFVNSCALNVSLYRNDSGFKGAGAARNIGIKKSTGDYIVFADSDDYFLEDAFNIIDERVNQSEADIYYFKPTSRCLISGKTSDRHEPYAKLVDGFLKDENQDIRYKFYVPWSKVYLRVYIESNDFRFDQVIASNDVMFSLKSAINARISVSNKIIYCVTRGVGTLTVNFSKTVLQSRLRVSLEESKYIFDNKISIERLSVLSLIKKSKFKVEYTDLKLIFDSYKKGYIRIFPKSYIGYLKSPKKIFQRLFYKSKSNGSIKDKKYRE